MVIARRMPVLRDLPDRAHRLPFYGQTAVPVQKNRFRAPAVPPAASLAVRVRRAAGDLDAPGPERMRRSAEEKLVEVVEAIGDIHLAIAVRIEQHPVAGAVDRLALAGQLGRLALEEVEEQAWTSVRSWVPS
jgi:hypothetical protein